MEPRCSVILHLLLDHFQDYAMKLLPTRLVLDMNSLHEEKMCVLMKARMYTFYKHFMFWREKEWHLFIYSDILYKHLLTTINYTEKKY